MNISILLDRVELFAEVKGGKLIGYKGPSITETAQKAPHFNAGDE